MEKLNNKKALVGLGVLGVAGLAGAAFAATNTVSDSSAGQGNAVTDGFTVTNVGYDATPDGDDETSNVVEVQFDIERDGGDDEASVNDADAEVYVQVRDGETRSDWAQCTVAAGAATCTLTGDEQINVEAIDSYSVIAFDIKEEAA
jgi:hypothetical protein